MQILSAPHALYAGALVLLTLRVTDIRDKGRNVARQIMIVLYGST